MLSLSLNRLSQQQGLQESSSEALIHVDVFGEGKFKRVSRGQYIAGPRRGQPCVAKTFKPGYGSFQQQLVAELRVIGKAESIVDAWNVARIIAPSVHLLVPELMVDEHGRGEHRLMEPLIVRYRKHNNNVGLTDPAMDVWNEIMQALSHFSYHHCRGFHLLCDIQGGIGCRSYLITDPVIHSITNGQFGPTDLGEKGILKFFASHRCNGLCLSDWTWPAELARCPAPIQRVPNQPRWRAAHRH
ncbi:MHCK/EF2 kinase [Apiospora marii]|uniref:MHCK/EF2 kinase n=1 Tax=Apiospora marii TaxID=335849 RepID=UPI003131AC23